VLYAKRETLIVYIVFRRQAENSLTPFPPILQENKLNIYVGNLSHEVTEEDLRQTFETVGQVSSATIIRDKFSGDPKGFGFVEMQAKAKGQEAILSLNNKELKGRNMIVNEARPRTENAGGARGGNKRW
jgi:RNA recognition motif-containing protein